MDQLNVLFVCLGNICRSPMAEGLFAHLVAAEHLADRFRIDSAGTSGHHDGERADARMRQCAQGHGITLHSRSRKVRVEDFTEFHYILAMDRSNYDDLLALARRHGLPTDGVLLMRSFEPDARSLDVPDPYYGGQDGFEEVYHILDRATRGFLRSIPTERLG
jgi:protein-tyrosine phosphatase